MASSNLPFSVRSLLELVDASLPEDRLIGQLSHPVLGRSFLESPFDLDADSLSDLIYRLTQIAYNRYPRLGLCDLEDRIHTWHGLGEESAVMGANGGFQILDLVLQMLAFRSEPRVLLNSPDFYAFDDLCKKHKISPRLLSLDIANNLNQALDEITSFGPDLLMISNPNNPTGLHLDQNSLARLVAEVPGLVLVDETYFAFAPDHAMSLLSRFNNLLICRSFSKTGLAAIRFGYLCGFSPVINSIKRFRLPFPVNSMTIAAANFVVDNPRVLYENARKIIALRESMRERLNAIRGCECYPSATNFLVVRLSGHDVIDVAKKLISDGIPVRPYVNIPILSDCIRLDVMDELGNDFAMERIKYWIS